MTAPMPSPKSKVKTTPRKKTTNSDQSAVEAPSAAAKTGLAPELWCSGDAPDSTAQHNFEGSWSLSETEPLINGRPHYDHIAPAQWDEAPMLRVHLFFVDNMTGTPRNRAPRWVIGPTASKASNGWAYTDSDAPDATEIIEPWHAYCKESSVWEEARMAFKIATAPVSLREVDE